MGLRRRPRSPPISRSVPWAKWCRSGGRWLMCGCLCWMGGCGWFRLGWRVSCMWRGRGWRGGIWGGRGWGGGGCVGGGGGGGGGFLGGGGVDGGAVCGVPVWAGGGGGRAAAGR